MRFQALLPVVAMVGGNFPVTVVREDFTQEANLNWMGQEEWINLEAQREG